MIRCGPSTYFDFSNMRVLDPPSSSGGNLTMIEETKESDHDEDPGDEAPGWMAMLSKDYDG